MAITRTEADGEKQQVCACLVVYKYLSATRPALPNVADSLVGYLRPKVMCFGWSGRVGGRARLSMLIS